MEPAAGFGSCLQWSALLDHLWQSTLFCAILLIPAVVLYRRAPGWYRQAILKLALLKFVVPAALLVALLRAAGLDPVPVYLSLAFALDHPLAALNGQDTLFHLTGFIAPTGSNTAWLVIWASGFAAALSLWLLRRTRFRSLLANGCEVCGRREQVMLERLRSRLSISRAVRLIELPGCDGPATWGSFRPVVVFPAGMIQELSDPELEALLLHELTHVRLWHNLWGDLQMLLCCFFWFHPLVWLLDRRLLHERELQCDRRVLELGTAAPNYAEGLIKVVRYGIGLRMAGASCAGGSRLKERIASIVSRRPEVSRPAHRLAVLAAVLLFLAFSLAAFKIDNCTLQVLGLRF